LAKIGQFAGGRTNRLKVVGKWSVSELISIRNGASAVSPAIECRVQTDLAARFRATRRRTLDLCQPLSPEDMMVQSCAEASPAKWHLAHTAWFFESFILREYLPGYRVFNPDFTWLFNSYYQSFAAFPEKRLRASFSRPSLDEILRYRDHVDRSIDRLLERNLDPEALSRIELGVNHEEQHQELILTDVLHAFFTNPLRPAYRVSVGQSNGTESALSLAASSAFETWQSSENESAGPLAASSFGRVPALRFHAYPGGLCDVGHSGPGFAFERALAPAHNALVRFQLHEDVRPV